MEISSIGSEITQPQVNVTPVAGMILAKTGWSWGAFMLTGAFLIGVKRYKLLWWYLLAMIPFVNLVFFIWFMIYLGSKGHEIAAAGTQFANQSEYDGFIKAADHAGKVIFFAMLILVGIGLVLALANLSLFFFLPKFSQT